MSRDDLVHFGTRDWAAVSAGKERYWAVHKREMTPADALRLGNDLRQFVRSVRPDWPSTGERAADLDTHQRVTEALRAVVVAPR